MSGIIYQYQQAYMPANGNTFHFWVDCSKEIYEEEAAEGGTVRLLYSAPAASLAELVPDEWTNEQCLEFLSIAFRHAEISGDIEMDDIRLAVKMVNAAAPEVE
ncbi:hypothetical protein [Pantoea agglomerans]|uniref:hypothetical protein n=1 Tax=Enterobacter agglomerans TaxID=549 RepID=UPI0030168789